MATPGVFQSLGVRPALGRIFSPNEDHVVVISDGLWREKFGAEIRTIIDHRDKR